MDELELLKKDWKRRENSFEQVTESEIYKMLHRKSSSLVKWILIVSILEVLFWIVISVLFKTDDSLKAIKPNNVLSVFEIVSYLNYGVIAGFIYVFYRNYVKISTTASTKTLMQAILRTRKTVQYYVYYNLAILTISIIAGFIMAFRFSSDLDALQQKMAGDMRYMIFTLVIMVIVVLLAVGVFWLFYRLLYGIMLKRLYANYKEVEKIDY
ncbi:MAG: hypothetical protein IR153_00180 [Flavobacterium sp.]|nr:hypothetical protein [Flavobacterium sp.]